MSLALMVWSWCFSGFLGLIGFSVFRACNLRSYEHQLSAVVPECIERICRAMMEPRSTVSRAVKALGKFGFLKQRTVACNVPFSPFRTWHALPRR